MKKIVEYKTPEFQFEYHGNLEVLEATFATLWSAVEAKKYIFYDLAETKNINADLHMASFKSRLKNA